jgi:hypothetical protein
LEEKIKSKLAEAEEKRQEHFRSVTERLREHETHIEEVKKATLSNNHELQEKIIGKLEKALNNREQHLESLKEKLVEQEKHAVEVREKALKNQTNTIGATECA